MKTIGIIGGVGPEATAQFYTKLIEKFRKLKNQQPRVIVWNIAVPDKLEHDALILGKNIDKFIPLLTEAAKELESAGAEMIVLPCNTLHLHTSRIRDSVGIPFISIIETTSRHIRRRNIKKLGLLGSAITVKHNLFEKQSPASEFFTVPHVMQKRMDIGLHHFVKNNDDSMLKNTLIQSMSFFQQNKVDDILVACTDFHNLIDSHGHIRLHDTLTLLVDETIKHALGTARKHVV